jgi:hypothetical protein
MAKLKTLLCDSHKSNELSSKRVVTLLAFVFCSIAFFANLFFDKSIDPFIYETMAWIVLGGFGSTAVEKFSGSTKSTADSVQNNY